MGREEKTGKSGRGGGRREGKRKAKEKSKRKKRRERRREQKENICLHMLKISLEDSSPRLAIGNWGVYVLYFLRF